MKILIDHPDDMIARVELRASLRVAREDLHLSGEAAARLAGFGNAGAVRTLEGATSWELWRVQQWARGLNQTVVLRIDRLRVPADDVRSSILRATTTFGGFDTDQMHQRLVAGDLVRVRLAQQVSRVELARRCRVDEKLLRRWEEDPTRSLLRTFQRYARGLGGFIQPVLQPVPAAVAS